MTPIETLRAAIVEFCGQDRVVTFKRPLFEFTGSIKGALLLSQIVYWSDKARHDGWFFKSYDEWFEETCLTHHEVARTVQKMKEAGYLETALKKANGTPTLHYRLNFSVFLEQFNQFLQQKARTNAARKGCEVDVQETGDGLPKTGDEFPEKPGMDYQRTGSPPNIEYDIEYKNTVASKPATNGLAFGGKTFGDHAAKALYEALIKSRKLTRRLSQKDFFKWRDEFNRFLKVTTCSKDEVKLVVRWYCQHLEDTDQFMPQAFSAKTFCEKFDTIRNRMGQSSTAAATGVGEDDPRLQNLNHEGKQWYIGTKKFCDDDPRVKELKRRIPNLRELSPTRDVLPFDEFNLVARELGLPEVGEEHRPRKATPEQIAKLDRIMREDEFDDDDAEWSMRRQ